MSFKLNLPSRFNRVQWRCLLAGTMMVATTLLSASIATAQTYCVTLRTGNAAVGQPDPQIRYIAPNLNCGQPIKNTPFTAADFAAAQTGANPFVVSPYSGWGQSLPCDPQARWIALGPNLTPARSALFAQPFTVNPGTVIAATIKFCWMADDTTGDSIPGGPNPTGVYINGVPIPALTGGNYTTQTQITASIPAGTLTPGVNWLYVYKRDAGCGISGLNYSAEICYTLWQCRSPLEQPWNDCLPSLVSRVEDCSASSAVSPLNWVVMDDFVAKYTGAVWGIQWWGVLRDAPLYHQRTRPFMVTIYRDNGDCRPTLQPIYWACVKPTAVRAGRDCTGRPVWKFSATLPGGFNQVQGARYWLQIAEIDRLSSRPGRYDFEWSGHRACGDRGCGCQALIYSAEGTLEPAFSVCDNQPMDLAWRLSPRMFRVGVNIVHPGDPTFKLEARLPGSDEILWSGTAEAVEDSDEEGTKMLVLETDLPDGRYDLWISGMGAKRVRLDLLISENGIEVSPERLDLNPVLGDLDGNNSIDDGDLLRILFNFGN
jgi:hypothetical protein